MLTALGGDFKCKGVFNVADCFPVASKVSKLLSISEDIDLPANSSRKSSNSCINSPSVGQVATPGSTGAPKSLCLISDKA